MAARRADAERNRRRVIAAAAEVHAEVGAGLGMLDVARRAGVGVGTVYRHFETREALLEALAHPFFTELLTLATDIYRDVEPGERLFAFVRGAAAAVAELGVPGHCQLDGASAQPARTQLRALMTDFVADGQAAGTLHADLTREDVAAVLWTNTSLVDAARDTPAVWRRHVELSLAGLRADGDRSVATPPVSADDWSRFCAAARRQPGRRDGATRS